MKTRFLSLAAAMAVVSVLALPVRTQAQQQTDGAAIENTYAKIGDSMTGGNASTGGTLTTQTGPSTGLVSEYANIAGASSSTLPSADTSKSISSLSYDLGAVGPQVALSVDVFGAGNSWVTAPSPSKTIYADGGGGVDGIVKGSVTGDAPCDPITAAGAVNAQSETTANTTVSPDSLSATSIANTSGMSDASAVSSGGTPQLTTSVQGKGGVEIGALVVAPNGAGASGAGAANVQYGLTNPTGSASGSQEAHGMTSTSVCPDGSCASAATQVSSQAQSKPY